ncbi:MAG: hypothetical protein ABIL02_00300 [candidate division WOR-3 bacterium]
MLKSVGEWGRYTGSEFPFFVIVTILCVVSFIYKRPNLESFLLFSIFFIAGLEMVRNVSLFAIISVFIIRELGLFELLKGKIKTFFDRFNLIAKPYQGILTFIIVMLVLFLSQNPKEFKIELSDYPVKAVEFIKHIKPKGNIFSQEVWSGYLLWELYPQYKVFFDAKGAYSTESIKDYYELMKPGPAWRKVLDDNNVNLIVLPPDKPLVLLLKATKDWKSVYVDSTSEIFLRAPLLQHNEN